MTDSVLPAPMARHPPPLDRVMALVGPRHHLQMTDENGKEPLSIEDRVLGTQRGIA